MKNFFKEFKTFITRGNVVDMAVGIIIGSAFTAIVTALTKNILTPLINWLIALIFGQEGFGAVYTVLVQGEDLASSIYIDWGAFIGAIINFLLVAIVLFSIVKAMNKLKEGNEKLKNNIKKEIISKEDRKELKKRGIKLKDKEAVKAYFAEKQAAEDAAKAEEEKLAEEKAKAERLANPTVEDLLKQIKELLEKKA